MIRVATGEFELDHPKLVIHPELTLPQFKAGDIPIEKLAEPNKMGWSSCWFSGVIEGMRAEFTVQFRFEKLRKLFWEEAGPNGESGEESTRRMMFKSEILDLGFTDVRQFYEFLRQTSSCSNP